MIWQMQLGCGSLTVADDWELLDVASTCTLFFKVMLPLVALASQA